MNKVPAEAGRPSSRHLAELDGIRGLAILMVMALHFICTAIVPQNLFERILAKGTAYGAWGVDLFFVLSGYLITGILWDTRRSGNYLRSFYGRRTLRIFPLYYGVLAVVVGLSALGVLESVAPGLSEVRKVHGWLWPYLTNVYIAMVGTFAVPYVTHFWSLAVEEHFYLFWPFVVRALSREALMRACVVLVVLSVAVRGVMAELGVNEVATYVLTFCRLDTLCMGAWFALWSRDPGPVDVRRFRRRTAAALAAVVVVSLLRMQLPQWDRILLSVREGLIGLFFGYFVAGSVGPLGSDRLRRLLRARWLSFLGKYSYGLYVFHGMVAYWFLATNFIGRIQRATGSRALALATEVIVGVVASVLIAVASFELYEKRFLVLKRLFEAAPPKRPAGDVEVAGTG